MNEAVRASAAATPVESPTPPRSSAARIRVLAALALAGAMGALVALKPSQDLPPYRLQVEVRAAPSSDEAVDVALVARPERPVAAPLQAEAFLVVDGEYTRLPGEPVFEPGGAVSFEGRVSTIRLRTAAQSAVGLMVGSRDTMPSVREVDEEGWSERVARPSFRVVTATIGLAR